jgi:hypothetical protein
MSIERFTQLCEAWGADSARWPPAERALYAQHAGTAAGRAALDQAAGLDRLLDDLVPRVDDPLRPARIVRAAREHSLRRRRIAITSGAWAASLVLGFVLGFTEPVSSDSDDAELSQLLLGSTVLEDYL